MIGAKTGSHLSDALVMHVGVLIFKGTRGKTAKIKSFKTFYLSLNSFILTI